LKFTSEEDVERYFAEQAALFTGAHYGSIRNVEAALVVELQNALDDGPEESIQRVLTANPYLFQYAMPNTGHHGVWVFPKRMIRTQQADKTPGLIPDYLVAASSSLGFTWHIVEIKRRDTQFASPNGKSLSAAGLKAVVQSATYLSHFHQYIETVRNNVGIAEIIQPENVIVLIGDSSTETQEQVARRAEFEQLAPRVKIVTYDRIIRGLRSDTHFWTGTDKADQRAVSAGT
jgi:hypothetical protein